MKVHSFSIGQETLEVSSRKGKLLVKKYNLDKERAFQAMGNPISLIQVFLFTLEAEYALLGDDVLEILDKEFITFPYLDNSSHISSSFESVVGITLATIHNSKAISRYVSNEDFSSYALDYLTDFYLGEYSKNVSVFKRLRRQPLGEALGSHANLGRESLSKLIFKGNLESRRSVSSRKDLTEEMFEFLARNESKQVRTLLAKIPATPQEILHRLGEDKDKEVRRMAQSLLTKTTPRSSQN